MASSITLVILQALGHIYEHSSRLYSTGTLLLQPLKRQCNGLYKNTYGTKRLYYVLYNTVLVSTIPFLLLQARSQPIKTLSEPLKTFSWSLQPLRSSICTLNANVQYFCTCTLLISDYKCLDIALASQIPWIQRRQLESSLPTPGFIFCYL